MLSTWQWVELDLDKAFEWYRLAAEGGNKEGQMNLGTMYLDGYGTEANLEVALEWFGKSLENGYESARVYIDRVKTRKLKSKLLPVEIMVEAEPEVEKKLTELEREAKEAREQIATLLAKLAMKDSEIEKFTKTAKIYANEDVPQATQELLPTPSTEMAEAGLVQGKEDEEFQKPHCHDKPLMFFEV